MPNTRTLTALVLAPIGVAVVLLLPTVAFAVLTAVLVLASLWEWTRLSGLRSRPIRAAIVAAVAFVLAVIWIYRALPFAGWLIAAGVAWWLIATFWLRHFSFGAAPTPENTALKLAGGILAVVPAWTAIAKLHGDAERGPYWTLLALLLVWSADTGAYLAGRRFGKTRLAPQISPNKTVAGAVGALAAGALVALAGGLLFDLDGAELIVLVLLGLATVVASIVGDLFESLVKRQAGVKDSGRFFPGHGGMFDRFDSLFAALPVFFAGKALIDLLLRS